MVPIHLKGGPFRRWFGNYEYVVNWKNDGEEIREISNTKYPYLRGNLGLVLGGQDFFFAPGCTWSSLSSARISMRSFDQGFLFDAKGQCFFAKTVDKDYLLAFYNSSVATLFLEVLAPTLDFNSGTISKVPLLIDCSDQIVACASICASLSKTDWDAVETSWDFRHHPML